MLPSPPHHNASLPRPLQQSNYANCNKKTPLPVQSSRHEEQQVSYEEDEEATGNEYVVVHTAFPSIYVTTPFVGIAGAENGAAVVVVGLVLALLLLDSVVVDVDVDVDVDVEVSEEETGVVVVVVAVVIIEDGDAAEEEIEGGGDDGGVVLLILVLEEVDVDVVYVVVHLADPTLYVSTPFEGTGLGE